MQIAGRRFPGDCLAPARTWRRTTISDNLELIPEHLRFAETLGWQPSIWGTLFIAVACMVPAYGTRPLSEIEWAIAGCSGAIGLALASYESWRRRNRTVLVRDGRNIAVFRKGHLASTLAPGAITARKPEFYVHGKIGLCLLFWAVALTVIAISDFPRGDATLADAALIVSIALACWVSLFAAIRVWITCTYLLIPVKEGRWASPLTVRIRTSRLKELFL